MNLKIGLIVLLISCLVMSLVLCLGVAAEDEAVTETTETVDAANATTGTEAEAAPKGLSTPALVSLIIGGVVLVALIVLCVVKREKVAEGLRSYRSEMKKITWYPWKAVWRCTVFVIVSVLITALVIGVLDIAFFEGQYLLTRSGVHFFGGQ